MLCERCSKLTRKAPDQMCETKFLQMCSFSIILTSVHLFPVLFYIISTTILKFPQCTATLIPNNFCISTQSTRIPTLIPCTRIPIPFLVFPHLFSAFLSFPYPIPYFGYYRQPAQFVIFKDLFQENSCLVPKQAPPFLLLHYLRHQIIFYIISVITKNYLPYSASSKKS